MTDFLFEQADCSWSGLETVLPVTFFLTLHNNDIVNQWPESNS